MTPDVDAALRTIMVSLMTEIAPDLKSDYRQASTNVLAVAMLFMADEYDRGAEVRAWENAEMRRLFGLCDVVVEDPDLKRRLAEAARGSDPSLRIAALNTTNAALKTLLIDLQTALEDHTGPAAQDARRRIWGFLRESADRRALRMG